MDSRSHRSRQRPPSVIPAAAHAASRSGSAALSRRSRLPMVSPHIHGSPRQPVETGFVCISRCGNSVNHTTQLLLAPPPNIFLMHEGSPVDLFAHQNVLPARLLLVLLIISVVMEFLIHLSIFWNLIWRSRWQTDAAPRAKTHRQTTILSVLERMQF